MKLTKLMIWEIDHIKSAFERCYNLKNMLSNIDLQNDAIIELAHQTGFRTKFIQNNIDLILKIE